MTNRIESVLEQLEARYAENIKDIALRDSDQAFLMAKTFCFEFLDTAYRKKLVIPVEQQERFAINILRITLKVPIYREPL